MDKEYYSYIKVFFDKLAPFYGFFDMLLAGLREKVVIFAGAPDGSKILDVCTGTGKQAFAFAKKGYNVIGVDLSESMLKPAIKRNKYSNLQFKVCDAASMPFENGIFDVSCVSFGLHEMPANIRENVIKEMVRVTKQGGAIVIVDYSLAMNKAAGKLAYRLIKTFESKYFTEFVSSGFRKTLETSGIGITSEYPILCGIASILKGSR